MFAVAEISPASSKSNSKACNAAYYGRKVFDRTICPISANPSPAGPFNSQSILFRIMPWDRWKITNWNNKINKSNLKLENITF